VSKLTAFDGSEEVRERKEEKKKEKKKKKKGFEG
jgi:hypothetical protein